MKTPSFTARFAVCIGLFTSFFIGEFATHAEEAGEYRTFTSTQGQSLKAKIVSATEADVKIVREDGKEFTMPLTRLSAADQEFIKGWRDAQPSEPSGSAPAAVESDVSLEKINETIGYPLFADGNLWENVPGDVAERLEWPRESETSFSSSYRKYPRKEYRLLGARPHSAVLYGEEQKVTSISIVYANKGDYFSAAGSGELHFEKNPSSGASVEGFRKQMEFDVKSISDALTATLGEPEKQTFGEGETRRKVLRWDWNGHAFLLSEEEDEFVTVAVEPTLFADERGKVGRTSDATIRERARANTESKENGDVVISNIPMVDQGPKGYCVPATAERCMRYLGIPADMYLLAMAGQTQMGGGTSVDLLLQEVGRDIKRKGRSLDTFNEDEMEIRKIAKYIDDGIPVMWTLFSTKEFNQIANERTKERADVTDWAEWTTKMEQVADEAELEKNSSTGHVVIIIGYNKETGEIAFSDSWGERYLERWITAEEAGQVSQGRFYVIKL